MYSVAYCSICVCLLLSDSKFYFLSFRFQLLSLSLSLRLEFLFYVQLQMMNFPKKKSPTEKDFYHSIMIKDTIVILVYLKFQVVEMKLLRQTFIIKKKLENYFDRIKNGCILISQLFGFAPLFSVQVEFSLMKSHLKMSIAVWVKRTIHFI